MSILRKIVSFIVLVAGIVVLVGLCLNSSMNTIWEAFANAFAPFDFQAVVNALSAFFLIAGNAIVLIMLGFIGISIPGRRRD